MRTFIITLLLLFSLGVNSYSQSKHEIRATWLTTLGGMDWPRQKATNATSIDKQKKELCNLLDKLKEANFNTILLQTRLRGDVIYPSSYETFSECLAGRTGQNPGYDPLAFAVDECHKRGMEIHAWIVTIPIGNNRQVKLLGRNSVVSRHRKMCRQHDGSWYLDPGNPETKDYLAGMVREIVEKYDVDGIHLDYIRYPEKAESFPDRDTYRRYGKGRNIKDWRRDNITEIVRRIYGEVKRSKPWVKVSSSPVGKYMDTERFSSKGWNAYNIVYQDAQGWLKEGIQDILFPMMYFNGNNFYPFALDWKENKGSRWVVPGLGIYFLSPSEKNWPLDEISRQIYFTRKYGLDGQAYFRTQFLLNDTKQLFSELKENVYNYKSLIPPMVWADSIPPTSPVIGSVKSKKDSFIMEWTPSTDNTGLPVRYVLYGSNSFPVDINKASNIIESYIDGNSYLYRPVNPWNSKVYFAVTAIDRYGNESLPLHLNEKISIKCN